MRTEFDSELHQLRQAVEDMGEKCQQALTIALEALEGQNREQELGALDDAIDTLEGKIEGLCLRLLLKQQPVAGDLRQISAALKMVTDFERIGDQAQDIGEIAPFLGQKGKILDKMGRNVQTMVAGSVKSYLSQDLALAQQVIAQDDEVDAEFTQIRTALIRQIAQDPDRGEQALDVLMIAKYLERIADHATNIAEWAEFSVTGVHRSQN